MSSELGHMIVETALRYLGRPYDRENFKCFHFVREVYTLLGLKPPPLSENLTVEQMLDPPIGHLLYLKHKEDTKQRRWSHVAIVISKEEVIHNSLWFGEKVVISKLSEILELYTIVPRI